MDTNNQFFPYKADISGVHKPKTIYLYGPLLIDMLPLPEEVTHVYENTDVSFHQVSLDNGLDSFSKRSAEAMFEEAHDLAENESHQLVNVLEDAYPILFEDPFIIGVKVNDQSHSIVLYYTSPKQTCIDMKHKIFDGPDASSLSNNLLTTLDEYFYKFSQGEEIRFDSDKDEDLTINEKHFAERLVYNYSENSLPFEGMLLVKHIEERMQSSDKSGDSNE